LHDRAYFPGNCVIAAAGNITHEALLKEVEAQGWFNGGAEQTPPPVPPVPPAVRSVTRGFEKDTAQTHIVFATDTIPYSDRRKYGLLVLSNVFGGGMSSRLFQRIREELGLAYAIYSFTSFYRAVGMNGVYVGTQPARAEKAVEAIRAEFARMAREGLRNDALDEAKQQTLGQLMLSLESPTSRMYRLASTAVYGESYRSLDEVLRTVEALTADEVSTLASEFFAPDRQTVVSLGPKP
ncbi:MAG TPA: pitrilysin family protein, partial [Gemmatimonadales bacterium]|nr:pitrilysin family protein [Gemmatimonadales bacterium]